MQLQISQSLLKLQFIQTVNGSVASADALEAGTYFVNVVQTTPEIGDVDFSISVDVTIVGCTDPIASNYNAYMQLMILMDLVSMFMVVLMLIAENYNASEMLQTMRGSNVNMFWVVLMVPLWMILQLQ